MIIGRLNIKLFLVDDFNRLLFGVELVKCEEFSYVLFSVGAGGLAIGYK
jgi:hypothetical protein